MASILRTAVQLVVRGQRTACPYMPLEVLRRKSSAQLANLRAASTPHIKLAGRADSDVKCKTAVYRMLSKSLRKGKIRGFLLHRLFRG